MRGNTTCIDKLSISPQLSPTRVPRPTDRLEAPTSVTSIVYRPSRTSRSRLASRLPLSSRGGRVDAALDRNGDRPAGDRRGVPADVPERSAPGARRAARAGDAPDPGG